jgi:hypothetical protein
MNNCLMYWMKLSVRPLTKWHDAARNVRQAPNSRRRRYWTNQCLRIEATMRRRGHPQRIIPAINAKIYCSIDPAWDREPIQFVTPPFFVLKK